MDTKFDVPLTFQPTGRSRALRRAAAALALTAAGAISVTAMAESRRADAPAGASDAQARPAGATHHRHAHRGPGGPLGFGPIGFGLPPGPHLDRVLKKIDATPEQTKQIHDIARAAGDDLRKQRDEGRALREEGLALFTQPQVDEKAAETWRQRTLAEHDAASRRMLQATLEISRVLTPEQRTKLAALVKERQARFEERLKRRGPPPPEPGSKQS